MRALRVLGLAEAAEGVGQNLVCDDPKTGEQFTLPCDDRLRAGARGDLSRFGQLEIESQSQLRPKEIQARIRAGASVEEVAALAGTSRARVESFAYPVLLERASMADKARRARPSIDGVTAAASVADTVTATLTARGHDGDIGWDAFKDEDGWILRLTWSAGRSENRATWLFHPGPGGGTLSARDEAAAEIVDPALRPLRPLRPIRQDAISTVLLDPTISTATAARPTEVGARLTEPASRAAHPAGSKLPAGGLTQAASRRSEAVDSGRTTARSARFGPPTDQPQAPARTTTGGGPADGRPVDSNAERLVEDTITDERSGVNPVVTRHETALTGTDSAARRISTAGVRPTVTAQTPGPGLAAPAVMVSTEMVPTATVPTETVAPTANSADSITTADAITTADTSTTAEAVAPAAPRKTAQSVATGRATVGVAKPGRRSQRPAMPSWEDVLLGTRSTGR